VPFSTWQKLCNGIELVKIMYCVFGQPGATWEHVDGRNIITLTSGRAGYAVTLTLWQSVI
jgi:hypothetical protein